MSNSVSKVRELDPFATGREGREPKIKSMSFTDREAKITFNILDIVVHHLRAERDSQFVKIDLLARSHLVGAKAIFNRSQLSLSALKKTRL